MLQVAGHVVEAQVTAVQAAVHVAVAQATVAVQAAGQEVDDQVPVVAHVAPEVVHAAAAADKNCLGDKDI